MSNHVVRIMWQIWRLWAGKRLSLTLPGPRAVGPGNPESAVFLVAFLAAPSRRSIVSPPATAEPHPPARVCPGSAQPPWFPWRPGLRRVPLPSRGVRWRLSDPAPTAPTEKGNSSPGQSS